MLFIILQTENKVSNCQLIQVSAELTCFEHLQETVGVISFLIEANSDQKSFASES